MVVGTTYGLYSAVEFPDNPHAHKSPFFEPLLEETAGRYVQIDLVSMDSAYLSKDNCDLVEDYGGTPLSKGGGHFEEEGVLSVDRDAHEPNRKPSRMVEKPPTPP